MKLQIKLSSVKNSDEGESSAFLNYNISSLGEQLLCRVDTFSPMFEKSLTYDKYHPQAAN